MSGYLIVNPAAGTSGDERAADLIARLTTAYPGLQVARASTPDEMRLLAREAVALEASHLFVMGGDGSVNAVLNAVASTGGLGKTTIGVLPGGTGNDLATTLGLPSDPEALIETLRTAETVPLDVGVLDEALFVNASAGGFFADVSEATNHDMKTAFGRMAYVIAGARLLLDHEGVRVTVDADTEFGPLRWTGDIAMFAVCNGPSIGGGRPVAPFACLDDALLDVFFAECRTPFDLGAVLLKASGGRHLADERVVGFRARSIEMRFERPVMVNVDGEASERTRGRYRVAPCAARFLVSPTCEFLRREPTRVAS